MGDGMSSGSRENRRSNVRRSNVTACTRCRSRKQRCDQNIPACSNCRRAGVPCISTDIDGQIAPRSYIKSLEDRVAYLELQLASRGVDIDAPHADFNANVSQGSSPSQDPIHEIASHTLENDTSSAGTVSVDGQSLLRSLLAEPLRSLVQSSKQSNHRSLLDELPYITRPVFPKRNAVKQLADAYFEHCDFFSPILSSKNAFLSQIEPLLAHSSDDDRLVAAAVTFRAFAVFAVAVLLLNRTDASFSASRAEAYFATALHILAHDSAAVCTGDLEHLRNLLIVVQYCCFNSNLAAAWHFIGLASRLAIELGLHDERGTKLDPVELENRRWVFWALYTSERNLCVTVGRPFSIPDGAIKVPLPNLAHQGIGSDMDHAAALHLIRYRTFESEMYTMLHQQEPSKVAMTEMMSWRDGMRQKLADWLSSAPITCSKSTQLAPADIFESIMQNSLVVLYYPSPLLPAPSERDLLILASSAANCINSYKSAFRDGKLRFFWRTTHNLFRCGVAIIYCLHVQATRNYPSLKWSQMVASVHTCMSILWAMVERYPAGWMYRDAFESLGNSVLGLSDVASSELIEPQGQLSLPIDYTTLAGMDLPQAVTDTLFWGFGEIQHF